MPIAALGFPQPIRRRVDVAPRDFGSRDRAIAAFEAGRHIDAVHETFRYLLPRSSVPDLTQAEYCFVQGSARIRARILADRLDVSAVLAVLAPDRGATAASRYLLTRVSATGQLHQPRLRDGVITLEYSDALSRSHPQKLAEVLQRLPTEADSNDGWMVERFGVGMLDREPVPELDDGEFARAESIWSKHWDAVSELLSESRRRRSTAFLDSLGSYAVTHMQYALPLFGALRADLNEHADEFNNREERADRRDRALAKCIKEMREVPGPSLRRCLGHSTYAINPLHEGTASLLSSVFGTGGGMQTTGELRASGRSLESALNLVVDYLYLLAYFSWPREIEAMLRGGLDLASDKPFREVADLLWNHANRLLRAFGNHGEQDGDTEDGRGEHRDRHDSPPPMPGLEPELTA